MRSWVIALLCAAVAAEQSPPPAPQPPAISELLAAYWQGEFDIVSKRFSSGPQVTALLPNARAWVKTSDARGWEFGSVVLFLELADAAIRLPDPSPRTAIELVRLGQDQLVDRRRQSALQDIDSTTELQWHAAALAVMQGARAFSEQIEYLKDMERRFPAGSPHLAMAAGIALEQQVAAKAPAATRERAVRPASEQERALDDATRQYDRAARDPNLRAEASARAAALFVKATRYRDALRRLELAGDSGEVLVESWLLHLRGLTLDGLDQKPAGVEFHERAKQLTGDVEDPWRELDRGMFRQVPSWLARLKGMVATSTTDPKSIRKPSELVLDRYAQGEFDAVAPALNDAGSLSQFSKDFQAVAGKWAAEATPGVEAEAGRRRNVAPAVALEAAQVRGLAERGDAQLLIEFACKWWQLSGPPTEAERLWQHASVALLEGMTAGVALELHISHGLKRFPDDPDLLMARGVAAELRAGPDNRTTDGLRAPDSSLLGAAESRLKTILTIPSKRPEASLRLGSIALRRGRTEEALTQLSAASIESKDPFIVHLAHLLSGRAFAKANKWREAVTSYRAAIASVPTQTAKIALVAALSRTGEYTEAAAVAEAALNSSDRQQDPWLSYGQGDFRHWPALIARVREAAVR